MKKKLDSLKMNEFLKIERFGGWLKEVEIKKKKLLRGEDHPEEGRQWFPPRNVEHQ